MIDLQPNTLNILLYISIFLGILLVYEGVAQFLLRGESSNEARNRRMKMIQGGASTDEVLQLLRDPAMMVSGERLGLIARLRRLLAQAGLTIGPVPVLFAIALFAAVIFVAASRFISPGLALVLSITVAVAFPVIVLVAIKDARAEKLTKQLPDALDLMARGLKVGHPVAVTVGNVATDLPDPIGSEFGVIQDQINYGDDVATAFRDFAKRVGTEDANYLAVSIGIQHGTGGNLARILNILSQVIRDRQTMQKKIKAISAEGRLSSLILTFLPVFIFLSIHLTTPSFYGDIQSDPLFPYFAGAIIGLTVIQGLILRRLVSFKF
ncbi:type II secretion system F family protein [Ruegeria profundi]|uniref:type II secretion system F family protein n=1 Tax=Ruegeria profundi TaxID=1685378 RepID=UPI001CD2D70C|nr:type II secretion system F family protein [Ruegeria profundi]MCA0930311.1 type II secretion system F family protein [Ruegeria profundi]